MLDDHSVQVLTRPRRTRTPTYSLYSMISEDLDRKTRRPSAPFLVSLGDDRRKFTSVTPLNKALLPFKRFGRRSMPAQDLIRPILREALDGHGVMFAGS